MNIVLSDRRTCPYCGSGRWTVNYSFRYYKVCACNSCSGVFHNPYFSEKEAVRFFSDSAGVINPNAESYYDRSFVEKHAGHTFKVFDWLLDYLESQSEGRRFLDVGFGMGFLLEKAGKRGWDTLGIDFSDEYYDYAKNKLNLNVLKTDLENFESFDKEFDVIVMWDIIEHLDAPADSVKKIYAMLKKGGLLAVATPNEKSLIADMAKFIYKITFGKIKEPLKSVYVLEHPLFFDALSLGRLLEKCGFNVILSKKDETDLCRLNLRGLKNVTVRLIFKIARFIGRQNRIIMLARK
ncbi:MAG: class I SAM-dependent methyltransferase [Candidatus Aureabacteria bacterium]|nr:class I SAM-dependent methyltransferase [Candidatus Auribacterota bacterium]